MQNTNGAANLPNIRQVSEPLIYKKIAFQVTFAPVMFANKMYRVVCPWKLFNKYGVYRFCHNKYGKSKGARGNSEELKTIEGAGVEAFS
jgi:hypothetical protein